MDGPPGPRSVDGPHGRRARTLSEAAEQHLAVGRTARYAMLGEPSAAVREIWFVLHGHAQLARYFIRPFAAIATAERLIVAPEALNRFYLRSEGAHGPESRVGATWMTREDRLADIADCVAYLDALAAHVRRPPVSGGVRLVGLGFSQGVATLVRWACAGAVRLDRLICWAGGLPQEFGEPAHRDRLASTRVERVVGDADPFAGADVVAADQARWEALGIPAPLRRFAGGHHLETATLQDLAG